jgi:hypothetical protein
MNGEELLCRFTRGKIGAHVRLVGSGEEEEFAGNQSKMPTLMDDRRGEVWVMSPDRAREIAAGDDEDARWGELFRKDFVPLSE